MTPIDPEFVWSRAVVSPEGDLQVGLQYTYPELDDELVRHLARRSDESRMEPWGMMHLIPGDRVMVSGVGKDDVQALHDALEGILKNAHERARPLRDRRERQEAEDRRQRDENAEASAEMTNRFRQFGR